MILLLETNNTKIVVNKARLSITGILSTDCEVDTSFVKKHWRVLPRYAYPCYEGIKCHCHIVLFSVQFLRLDHEYETVVYIPGK